MLKIYEVIIDGGDEIVRRIMVAKSMRMARQSAAELGEVVRIRDVTAAKMNTLKDVCTMLFTGGASDETINIVKELIDQIGADTEEV